MITGNFNIYLQVFNRISRLKISKARETLNNTINHLDLIDICGKLQNVRLYILFKYAWNIYQGKNCTQP